MNKLVSREIAYLGVYVGLMLALTFIPYTGYITVGPIAITTLPILIGIATWHQGSVAGLAVAIAFGFGSYFKALSLNIAPLFVNYPELAILPRLFLGFLIVIMIKIMGKINFIKVIITGALTIFFNTLLITCWFFLIPLYRNVSDWQTFKAWMILIYINFFIELGVAIFLSMITYKLVVFLQENMYNQRINSWK